MGFFMGFFIDGYTLSRILSLNKFLRFYRTLKILLLYLPLIYFIFTSLAYLGKLPT
jgi:hypothetical protein